MTAWLDLFTGKTYQEFMDAGSRLSGFRENAKAVVARIQPSDLLVCYVTGISRFVGVLKVVRPSSDSRAIWSYDKFPVRLEVQPDILLHVEEGVTLKQVEQAIGKDAARRLRGLLRRSPSQIPPDIAATLIQLVAQAARDPQRRPVDPRALQRAPRFVAKVSPTGSVEHVEVEIPEADADETHMPQEAASAHIDAQGRLLDLGNALGLQVWVASNDRGRAWKKTTLGALPGNIAKLPLRYDELTNQAIELIDVLWLRRNTIVAAFEVECTTSVYSGLLRMSDLLALQPNLTMPLYIVAPMNRREKVRKEILRPTFQLGDRPLSTLVRFLSLEKFIEEVAKIERMGLTSSLNPNFLEKISEGFSETGKT